MTNSLEESELTSIYELIHSVACQRKGTGEGQVLSFPTKGLGGFVGNKCAGPLNASIEWVT